jgi:hypothetical protein
MKCSECGALAADDDEDCPNCGKSLSASTSDPQEPNKYYCEDCNDELEYISTYKQWYCYNCQKYVDHPEPSSESTDLGLEPSKSVTKEVSEEVAPKEDIPEVGVDTVIEAGPDTIPESSPSIVSWEDEASEIEPEEDLEDEEELEEEDFDSEESVDHKLSEIKLYEATDKAAEISWDEALASEDAASVDLAHEPDIISLDSPDVDEYDPTVDEVSFEGGLVPEVESDVTEPNAHKLPVDAESDIEFEIDQSTLGLEPNLKQKSLQKLHDAWLRVNNLKGLIPDNKKILELESDLKSAMDGKLDTKDTLVLADESLDEVAKLEKELKDEIHNNVSELFHFVNAKMFLAKKIGFNVEELEEELDNISSLIARSEYHQAHSELDALLQKAFDLPKTQDEIMIGLDENSEIMKEFLEPRTIPATQIE